MACSAFCYYVSEHVGILAVVMAIAELGQVQRQVVLTYLVIRADHAPLEQAPKAVQVRGVDISAHILTLEMIDGLVRELSFESGIAGMFVGRHQRHLFAHRIPDKIAHGYTVRILDDLTDHIALTSNRANDTNLPTSDSGSAATFATMSVLVFPADVGFIDFNLAHQLAESAVLHGGADAMAQIPSGAIGPAPDHTVNLKGADPLLALKHQIENLKPRLERVIGILKNRLGDDRKAIAVPSAARLGFADPVKRTGLECIHVLIIASRTLHAMWPAPFLQILFAGFFGGEAIHRLRKCQGGFHDLASVMLRPVYASSRWVSSSA